MVVEMLLAKKDDKLINAQPSSCALCPNCNKEVISKCGDIKIWHWAHKNKECDYKTEAETDWHLEWKQLSLFAGCNIEKRNRSHILDAININTKNVYEFQHSPISSDELKKRSFDVINSGYKINWIFDYREHDIQLMSTGEKLIDLLNENKIIYFKLKYYNQRYKALFQNNQPIFGDIYLDLQKWTLFELLRIVYLKNNGHGCGYPIRTKIEVFNDFVNRG